MYKSFHNQLDYIINELVKRKENNHRAFAFIDDDFVGSQSNNVFVETKDIIINMSVARLNKLISCKGLNHISSFCTWRNGSFCSHGYSGHSQKGPYDVNRSYFYSMKDNKTISGRREFIKFLSFVVGHCANLYPKLRKHVVKKGEGLFLYACLSVNTGWKGIDRDYYKVLERTKDNRVKRFIIRNINSTMLSKFNEKYVATNLLSFDSNMRYAIYERLKKVSNNSFDYFIQEGLKKDPMKKSYDWSQSLIIAKDMLHRVEGWSDEEKVNVFQNLSEINNNSLKYGFYSSTATRCLNYLIYHIPKEKIPFILNSCNDTGMDNVIKYMMEEDPHRWSA